MGFAWQGLGNYYLAPYCFTVRAIKDQEIDPIMLEMNKFPVFGMFLFLFNAFLVIAQDEKSITTELIDFGKDVKLEMVLIQPGIFKMGSPKKEKDHRVDERQHIVILTKSFYLGKYEVTQEQWEAVMGDNPSFVKGAKLPVNGISWEQCQAFIKKLNTKTNGGYRLPTEAEWEYACRAGTKTAYSFGDEIRPKDFNYDDSKLGKPVSVGNYKPNAFGLYDMHGNVWEWCEDWHGYYPPGKVTDPQGPAKGEYRVIRSGSFYFSGSMARSSARYGYLPTDKYSFIGLRLAKMP